MRRSPVQVSGPSASLRQANSQTMSPTYSLVGLCLVAMMANGSPTNPLTGNKKFSLVRTFSTPSNPSMALLQTSKPWLVIFTVIQIKKFCSNCFSDAGLQDPSNEVECGSKVGAMITADTVPLRLAQAIDGLEMTPACSEHAAFLENFLVTRVGHEIEQRASTISHPLGLVRQKRVPVVPILIVGLVLFNNVVAVPLGTNPGGADR